MRRRSRIADVAEAAHQPDKLLRLIEHRDELGEVGGVRRLGGPCSLRTKSLAVAT